MNWKNNLTDLLQIKYPLIQAPMLGVTTPEMVAAAANKKCLGSLPLGLTSKEKAREAIRKVKALTGQRFAVNLFAYKQPGRTAGPASPEIEKFYRKYQIPFPSEIPGADPYPYYTDLIEMILEEKIPVVSFHFGLPDKNTIEILKSNGVILMVSATCTGEAAQAESAGMDIVIAQGWEAGGHRGSFGEEPLPQVGLFALLPQIAETVSLPVVAAGGLTLPQSLAAAFVLGASGVQLGSAFLRSPESAATPAYKSAVASAQDNDPVVTRVWSGRPGRCLSNDFVAALQGEPLQPYPIQNFLTEKLRAAGKQNNEPQIQSLWAGQTARFAQEKPTAEIIDSLLSETEKILSRPLWKEQEAATAE